MIKKDIVEHLYETHGGITREDAEQFTEIMLEMLKDGLPEEITITGFGRFRQKKKAVRKVVLPSGETRDSSGERTQFLPGPKLKAYINDELEDYQT